LPTGSKRAASIGAPRARADLSYRCGVRVAGSPARLACAIACASALAAFGGACSSSDGGAPGTSAACADGGACNGGCPAGFEPDASGSGCIDVSPGDAAGCAPGTAPLLGNKECAPIADAACPASFEKDPSGWGCRAKIDDAPVAGCDLPFPPANATIFVDPSAPEDATHKKKLFDAVLGAPANAVIAVAPGRYLEDVDVTRPVTIAGKCAAEVVIENPGDRRAGILVTNATGVTVRGVTLKGHTTGVYVKGAGDVTVEDSVLDANKWMGVYVLDQGHAKLVRTRVSGTVPDATGAYGWGIAAQKGGSIELEDSAVVRATGEGIVVANPGTKLRMSRSVVRDTLPDAKNFAFGVSAAGGASAEITESLLSGNPVLNLQVTDAATIATVTRSSVTASRGDGRDDTGRGIQILHGGRLVLVGSWLSHNAGDAIVFIGPDSSGTIEGSTVTGALIEDETAPGRGGILAAKGTTLAVSDTAIAGTREVGLIVQDEGTTVTATKVLVTGTRGASAPGEERPELGYGVGVAWGGSLEMTGSAIVRNHSAGLLVTRVDASPAHATVRRTVIAANLPNDAGLIGRGAEVDSGASLTLEECAVKDNHELGILIGGAGSVLNVHASAVRNSVQNAPNVFGDGIVAADGATVTVDGSWILRHPGIGLAFAGARATVTSTIVLGNGIGIHVQDGSTLRELGQKEESSGLEVGVAGDTRFIDNQTREDSAQLTLPSPLPEAPKK
jgi:Right handed beta helix region